MNKLDAHSLRVRKDLEVLGLGQPTWVTPRSGVYDVVIVGGGQSGLAAAFGLIRERISNILVIDENPKGQEGPWVTYARMITLRTPKDLLSIEHGIPSLTFRAWWSARHGEESWNAIGKIPRGDWMDYLRWYRDVLDLPVENEVKLRRIEPSGDGVHQLHVEDPSGPRQIKARKVILATGIQGGGEWHTPEMIRAALPRSRFAHTSECIDFAALKGKRIGILGGGASAFDNAQHALELGAACVDVFMRRTEMPRVNPIRFMEKSGVVPRFSALNDAEKYKVISYFMRRNQPPTNDTFQRAASYPGFSLHLGAQWEGVRETPDGIEVTTPKGVFVYDFIVLSTGLLTDVCLRPELAALEPHIARWGDRFKAPPEDRSDLLDLHPYLGEGFEFTPRTPEQAPFVHGVFAFNYSALLSLGLSASALTGLPYALPRLVRGVADQLFLDDKSLWMSSYFAYADPEFVSEWSPAAGAKVDAQ